MHRRHRDGAFTGEELTVRHWGLNPDERTRVQAQRNAAVDVMNSDGYLSVASGRWKARYSCGCFGSFCGPHYMF